MRLAVVVILAVALATPALAVDDVPGWQSLRWGMTESETRRSLESSGYRVVPPAKDEDRWVGGNYAPFKTHLNIDGNDYEVFPLFPDGTKRLNRVTLQGRGVGHFLEAQAAGLLKLLTEKYGAPQADGMTMRWRFKTTTIELFSAPTIGLLHLHYAASAAPLKKDDKGKI